MFSIDQFNRQYDTERRDIVIDGRRYWFFVPQSIDRFIDPEDPLQDFPLWAKIWPALTEPICGSTKSRSRSLAFRAHAGGQARICASSIFPDASSFFSSALAVRTSFACSRARRRCSRDLPGTHARAFPSDTQRF